MLETMSSANKWTLKSWRETLDSQLNSWLMYIPGMSTSNEAQEMKKFKGNHFQVKDSYIVDF